MMDYQIFISYRWSNSGELAGRIYERLTYKEGFYVFLDEESNLHDVSQIKACISESRVFILILGVGSFDRCNDEKDILRCEIRQALQEHKHIIIVQTGNFKMPNTLPNDITSILNLIRLRHIHGDFSNLYNKIIEKIPIQPYGRNMLDFHKNDIYKNIFSTFTNLNYMKNVINLFGSTISFKNSIKDWQSIADKVHKVGTVNIVPLGLFALSFKVYCDFYQYFKLKSGNIRNNGDELICDIDKHYNDNYSLDVSILNKPKFSISSYLDSLKYKQLFLYSKEEFIFMLVSAKEYSLFIKLI